MSGEPKKGFLNPLLQQKLKAWQPMLSPSYVIGLFTSISVLFFAIGIAVLLTNYKIYENRIIYDQVGTDYKIEPNNQGIVTVTFDRDVEGPLFLYYELNNVYQNHRRFLKSVSPSQLFGYNGPLGDSSCEPLTKVTNYEMNDKTKRSNQVYLYPCGLIANAAFNDTFYVTKLNPNNGTLSQIDLMEYNDIISWSNDVKFKYRQINPNENNAKTTVQMWVTGMFPIMKCVPTNDYFNQFTNQINKTSQISPNITNYTPLFVSMIQDQTNLTWYPDCDDFPDTTLETFGIENLPNVTQCRYTSKRFPYNTNDLVFNQNVNGYTLNDQPKLCTDFPNHVEIRNPSNYGVNNGHFINWMRVAGLPTFRKLYGRINQNFKAGDQLNIFVESEWPVTPFLGSKAIVLSGTSWMGGRNGYLGAAYLTVAVVSALFVLVYVFLHYKYPNRIEDVDRFLD